MSVEEKIKYYKMDTKGIINNLIYDIENRNELLKDKVIKNKIINDKNYNNLLKLLDFLDEYSFNILFDEIGISILSKSSNLSKYLNKILEKYNIDYFFKNNEFIQALILKSNTIINSLPIKYILLIINNIDNMQIYNLFRNLDDLKQLELIKNYKIPNEMLKLYVINSKSNTLEYLLYNDLRINFINDLDYNQLYNLFNKNIKLPKYILNDNEFINKIVTIINPKDYRYLIDTLKEKNDIEFIEKKRKVYYLNKLNKFNSETKMLDFFDKLYNEIIDLSKYKEKDILNKFNDILKKYINQFGSNDEIINNIIEKLNNPNELKLYFQKESNYLLTEMIIDYYFEQNYYNFFLDLNELIRFQSTEGKTINDEMIEIYSNILNLDKLPYEEKLNLFNKLKELNISEKYYDDYRSAKNKEALLMKEQMLNFDNIDKYKNQELTNKYRVDVCVLDGEPFYALVKGLKIFKTEALTKERISTPRVDGSSYSLDSSYKLDTYFDPKINYNIIYGDFNIDSIVHMCSTDSYSRYYHSAEFGLGTEYLNELKTPYEFVTKSPMYNEIIYAQRNYERNDEVNNNLDVPKILGIYVYDEITLLDIESAKNLNCKIVLVNTKKYQSTLENKMKYFENKNSEEINYYLNEYNMDHRKGR